MNDGVAVLHDTIQYLVERSENEQGWLDALAESSVPTTLVWGMYDTVSPPRVAAYIWNTYLSTKPGVNQFWLLPAANHYLQHDQPKEFVEVVSAALAGHPQTLPARSPTRRKRRFWSTPHGRRCPAPKRFSPGPDAG